MTVKVSAHAGEEDVHAEPGAEHADDAGALVVGDGIEDLVDFRRVTHGDLDGVRRAERVQAQSARHVTNDETGEWDRRRELEC